MANSGIIPNRVTCNITVHALCKKGLLEDSRKLLMEILGDTHRKDTSNLITSTILMGGSFNNGHINQALTYLDGIFCGSLPVAAVAYNVVIHGFCLLRDISIAYKYVC